jgi:ribosomal protein S18 acetylase RimI-like enzyme
MFVIRNYRPEDLPVLTAIMVDAFEGVSIDQGIENVFGPINGRDWKWRKARHLAEDARRDPLGIFVAECDGKVVGFVSTWMDRESGIGHIPNISLTGESRGLGLGRQLLEHALARFRQAGLTHAKIETLAHNAIGNHLYPSVGFKEVARQVHFVAELGPLTE